MTLGQQVFFVLIEVRSLHTSPVSEHCTRDCPQPSTQHARPLASSTPEQKENASAERGAHSLSVVGGGGGASIFSIGGGGDASIGGGAGFARTQDAPRDAEQGTFAAIIADGQQFARVVRSPRCALLHTSLVSRHCCRD